VIKTFTPRKFLAQDDVVVVIGNDEADVISTGKSYSSDWVYIFTLKEQKITHVQAYIDTLEIAKAFRL
jgi:ketosteroid isomerase-like protein